MFLQRVQQESYFTVLAPTAPLLSRSGVVILCSRCRLSSVSNHWRYLCLFTYFIWYFKTLTILWRFLFS